MTSVQQVRLQPIPSQKHQEGLCLNRMVDDSITAHTKSVCLHILRKTLLFEDVLQLAEKEK